jgi:hypothetical protein
MAEPRLHLDADASAKALHEALLERGHDVTRTPTDWMERDAGDEQQLLGATAHGRCIFTFNVRDFIALARRYPRHGGIILAAQSSWTLPDLVAALDRLLSETKADPSASLRAGFWTGQVRWLNEWREGKDEDARVGTNRR